MIVLVQLIRVVCCGVKFSQHFKCDSLKVVCCSEYLKINSYIMFTVLFNTFVDDLV